MTAAPRRRTFAATRAHLLYVPSPGLATYAVAEGVAELSAVAQDRDDYRRAMAEDRRLVIRLRVERRYGYLPA